MINVSLWKYIRDDLKGIESRLEKDNELKICKYLINLAVEDIDQHLFAIDAMQKENAKKGVKESAE